MALKVPGHPGDGRKIPNRYTVHELIGSGTYGVVHQATASETGEEVAIKRCERIFKDWIGCKRVLREIAILSKLQHGNVLRIIDLLAPGNSCKLDKIDIVMELADSNLKELCEVDATLCSSTISGVLYTLLAGVRYIHSAGICHRDLQPANCFVNQECTVKIGGFSQARALNGKLKCKHPSHLTGHSCAMWYRAPELILVQGYTEAIDLWSVGCIYAELLGMLEGPHVINARDRRPLFPGTSWFPLSPDHVEGQQDMLNTIFNIIGTPTEDEIAGLADGAKEYVSLFAKRQGAWFEPKFLPNVDLSSWDMLADLLRFSPSARLTAQQALEHPLLAAFCGERQEAVAPELAKLDFEKEEEDLGRHLSPALRGALLRRQYWREVQKYHQMESIEEDGEDQLATLASSAEQVVQQEEPIAADDVAVQAEPGPDENSKQAALRRPQQPLDDVDLARLSVEGPGLNH